MKPEEIRALRERIDMSRREFGQAYRLPVRTVQDWELGNRQPDAAAEALLTAIGRDHETMRRLLACQQKKCRPGETELRPSNDLN